MPLRRSFRFLVAVFLVFARGSGILRQLRRAVVGFSCQTREAQELRSGEALGVLKFTVRGFLGTGEGDGEEGTIFAFVSPDSRFEGAIAGG